MRPAVLVTLALLLVAGCSTSGTHTGPTTPTTPVPPAVIASVGCGGAAEAVSPGQTKLTLVVGGLPRWYFRQVPAAHDGVHPIPLVVDLHGYSEGAQIHTAMSQLGPFGDQHGFMTVTPQGSGVVPLWNTAASSPDMAFIGALLDDVEKSTCVDTRRVFVTGLSNGAFMTSAVACAYSARVAAIAPIAGVRDVTPCPLARPVPVIAFHGTADPLVAYTGGFGPKVANLPAPDGSGKTIGQSGAVAKFPVGESIPDIMTSWAQRDGCGTTVSTETIAADVTRLSYPCPAEVNVELYRIEGGGHAWPGSTFSAAAAAVIGKTTMSISADELIWAFFQAHPLPAK